MFELLYVFNTAAIFFVACNASIVDLGNNFKSFQWPWVTISSLVNFVSYLGSLTQARL